MEAKDDASLADELEPWQVFRSLATPVTFWHDEQGWKDRADAFTAALRHQQSGEADEAYEIGKRDGYEEAIQELDKATGGDGEFFGSTIPGQTVDVPVMKQRIIDRFDPTPKTEASEAVVELAERFGRIAESGYDIHSKQTVWVTPGEASLITAALARLDTGRDG